MVAYIFGPDLGLAGFGFVLSVLICLLPIRALVDVADKSKVAFYQAGSSKTAWIVVLAVGLIFSPLGIFSACYYYFGVRNKVERFQKS